MKKKIAEAKFSKHEQIFLILKNFIYFFVNLIFCPKILKETRCFTNNNKISANILEKFILSKQTLKRKCLKHEFMNYIFPLKIFIEFFFKSKIVYKIFLTLLQPGASSPSSFQQGGALPPSIIFGGTSLPSRGQNQPQR